MTRYFFDLADGSREPDEDGVELADHEEAEREAIRFLGEVLRHEPERLDHGSLRVDVHDVGGTMRCTINVSKENGAPAGSFG